MEAINSALAFESVTKRFGHFEAVRELNLTVQPGRVFGLLGPNGAGKTTAIMMLLGSIRPTSGRARLFGASPADMAVRRRIGFLPERFQFHDFLTAREFLHLHGKLSGMSATARRIRVPEVLERVGLADRANSRIREFSRGMQQRLGLAQAIQHDPDLIILDEPTSALDPLGRRDVRDIILELRGRGKTVLLNSHLLSEIEAACDEIAIMKRGELLVKGAISDLLRFTSRVELEARNMTDAAMRALNEIAPRVERASEIDTKWDVWVRAEEDIPRLARALVQNGVDIMALTPHRETLEELFIRTIES